LTKKPRGGGGDFHIGSGDGDGTEYVYVVQRKRSMAYHPDNGINKWGDMLISSFVRLSLYHCHE
jgi:hypothetical protein